MITISGKNLVSEEKIIILRSEEAIHITLESITKIDNLKEQTHIDFPLITDPSNVVFKYVTDDQNKKDSDINFEYLYEQYLAEDYGIDAPKTSFEEYEKVLVETKNIVNQMFEGSIELSATNNKDKIKLSYLPNISEFSITFETKDSKLRSTLKDDFRICIDEIELPFDVFEIVQLFLKVLEYWDLESKFCITRLNEV